MSITGNDIKKLKRSYKTSPAIRISTIYIIISCVYIVLSDYLVSVLLVDIKLIRIISIYKGWGFVLLSGLFIYWISRRKKKEPNTSEEKYQVLADLTFEGIVLHENGIVIDINKAFSNITGYSREELIGENIIELMVDPGYRHISYDNSLKKDAVVYEILTRKKDGDVLWGEINSKPILYQGKHVRIVAFRDITARKQAEMELVENEKQLLAIFNSTPLLMMLLDMNGRVLKANHACLSLSDKRAQEVIGLFPGEVINCNSLQNENDRCGYTASCSNCVLNNSIKYTIETHANLYKRESKLTMGKLDNVFERNTLISTLYIDIGNKSTILVNIDDITERVQMENILREKNALLVKAQEIAKVGEFYYDIKTKTFKLSDSLAKITGQDSNIMSVEEMYNSIHPDDREDTRIYLQDALANLNNYSNLYRRYKPDGELQYLLTYAEIERDENGKAKRVFGVSSDITEQKKVEIDLQMMNYELQTAEEELRSTNEELLTTNEALRENLQKLDEARRQAEESDRLKSAFLANMSHEIRTPMNAIMGFADILDMEDMPFEKRKMFTKTIRQRTKDLLNIINDILDIARIESHTLRINERQGNVNDILMEINNFFTIREEELSPKSIRFEVNNELVDGQNIIKTDFDRLKQVLINLIDNAHKYTPKGEIIVGCKLVDASNLQFSVKDTGIGISKENLELVFERFRQVDESYLAREYGGTGLGLSICKGIIDLLGGKIWVESEIGKGSTFFFNIPYKPIQSEREQRQSATKDKKIDYSGKTILIVEDVDYNMDYLVELFRLTNATLLKAKDGASAISVFHENNQIDLVLMDIRLPDTNGFDLTKKMLNERPGLKIIAQTAYASDEDKAKCLQAGCVNFVTKPITQTLLFETLSKYI